jgi:hypothetical protein
MTLIAQLGGYLDRKCAGPAGFQSMWKGYTRFNDMVKILTLSAVVKVKRL